MSVGVFSNSEVLMFAMIRRVRRLLMGLTVLGLSSLVFAGSAFAYSAQVSNGDIGPGGSLGPLHTLTGVNEQSTYGTDDCAVALDQSYNIVGTPVCSTGYNYHAYCQCALRYGFNYPYYNQTDWMAGAEFY